MHKRFYVQRQHIIHSLDTVLYQLHTLSFFLSPSLWLYICRLVSQFQCSKPRELDSNRSLRFFYAMVVFLNLPSIWNHSTKGAAEGRAIVLDFIGMAYTPSKLQLCCLDIFIVSLQILLTTIAYETSVYHTNEETDPQDILLPDFPNTLFDIPDYDVSPDSPITPSLPPPPPKADTSTSTLPFVIDMRLNSILTHLHNPPPPPRNTNADSALPLPNTTAFPLPGMGMLLRAGRQMRTQMPNNTGTREMRIPGAMEDR